MALYPSVVEKVKQERTIICEWDTPRDLDLRPFFQGAKKLHEAGIDAITMADNSLAMARTSNIAVAALLQEKLQIHPLVHVACRDRSLLGHQSHLMGLHALGIDQILVVTGDPSRIGDLPESSMNQNVNSFDLIRKVKDFNQGITFSGKKMGQSSRFVVGAAFNPNVRHLEAAVKRLEKKIEAGADFIMTQPVFEEDRIEELYEATKHISVPIFIGIMPITGYRNALFLHEKVPGIKISARVRKQMETVSDREEGKRLGVEIGKELLDVALPRFKGIYLITPFTFWEMSEELAHYIRRKDASQINHQKRLLS